MKVQKVQFDSLKIGDFFKLEEYSVVKYQVRESEGPHGTFEKGYNTRTGEMEYIYGLVYPVDMSESEISSAQSDNEMWGLIWASHEDKVKADIA